MLLTLFLCLEILDARLTVTSSLKPLHTSWQRRKKNSFITNQVKYRYEYDFKRVKVFDTDFLGGNLSGHRVLSESSTLEPQKERG